MSRSPSRGRGDSSRGPPASSSGGSSGHSNEVGTPAVEPLPEFPEPARVSPLFRRTPSYRRYQSRYVGSYSAAIGNYYRALNADQGLVPQGVNLEHAEQTTAAGRAAELQQARGTIATESYVMRTHFEQLLREAGFITERNQWHPETPEDVNLLHGEAIRAYRRVMQWFGVCAHVPGAAYAPTSPTPPGSLSPLVAALGADHFGPALQGHMPARGSVGPAFTQAALEERGHAGEQVQQRRPRSETWLPDGNPQQQHRRGRTR
jgi:hypothetical protein